MSRSRRRWPWSSELADLGPRLPSTPAHDDARDLLADRLSRLGVEEVRVEAMANGTRNVEGLLRGADPGLGEIVLAAHYDTVADSPGAADDAAGCAVALGVVAELLRAPLRRSLRVVFFDGEEAGLLGSEAWVERLQPASSRPHSRQPPSRHRRLRPRRGAGGARSRRHDRGERSVAGAGVAGPCRAQGGRRGRASRFASTITSRPFARRSSRAPRACPGARTPWCCSRPESRRSSSPTSPRCIPTTRCTRPTTYPARIDAERLGRWVLATAAVIRRLDALEGRPRWEEEYLAFGGRVWIRRDLLWIGLALWIALVLRGRPGRWAGARA